MTAIYIGAAILLGGALINYGEAVAAALNMR